MLTLECGMRTAEVRNRTWKQINFEERFLTGGKAKTAARTDRTLPLNEAALDTLVEHAHWYVQLR